MDMMIGKVQQKIINTVLLYSSTRPFGARAKSDLWTEYGLFVSLDGGDFNWAIVAFMNAGNVKMCCWPERMVCEARAKRARSRP